MVNDPIILNEIDLDDYLENKFIPYIKEYYANSLDIQETADAFLRKLVDDIRLAEVEEISEVTQQHRCTVNDIIAGM